MHDYDGIFFCRRYIVHSANRIDLERTLPVVDGTNNDLRRERCLRFCNRNLEFLLAICRVLLSAKDLASGRGRDDEGQIREEKKSTTSGSKVVQILLRHL